MESQTRPYYLEGLGECTNEKLLAIKSKYVINYEIKYGPSSYLGSKSSVCLRRPCSNLALSDPSEFCTRKERVLLLASVPPLCSLPTSSKALYLEGSQTHACKCFSPQVQVPSMYPINSYFLAFLSGLGVCHW